MAQPAGAVLPETINTQIEAYLDATQAVLNRRLPPVLSEARSRTDFAISILGDIEITCARMGIDFEVAQQEIARKMDERAKAMRGLAGRPLS